VCFVLFLFCLFPLVNAFQFKVHCGSAFEPGANVIILRILQSFPFLFFFCHPFGGRDSPKKWKILKEIRGEGTRTRPDYWGYLLSRADTCKKNWGATRGKIVARKSRNSHDGNGRSVSAKGMMTNLPNCFLKWTQIQTLKDWLCCHICCAQLGTSWDVVVNASLAVSDRESRCPLWSTSVCSWVSHELHTVSFGQTIRRTRHIRVDMLEGGATNGTSKHGRWSTRLCYYEALRVASWHGC